MKIKFFLLVLLVVSLATGCGGNKDSSSKDKDSYTNNTGTLEDLTVETAANKLDREDILTAVRKELTSQNLPASFKVRNIKEKDGFAFVEVDVTNPDGSQFKVENPAQDCCYFGAVMKVAASQWVPLASSAFPTDVWYMCMWNEYSAPREIFPSGGDDECK